MPTIEHDYVTFINILIFVIQILRNILPLEVFIVIIVIFVKSANLVLFRAKRASEINVGGILLETGTTCK